MNLANAECVSSRDFSRSLGRWLTELEEGRKAKLAILHRNRIRGVVVNVETYERLINSEQRLLELLPQSAVSVSP